MEPPRLRWDLLDAVRDATESLGIPRTEDFNRGDNEGSSSFKVDQRRGMRWNTVKAFLKSAKDRRNLAVETGAPVKRLVLADRRVTGAEFEQGGMLRSVNGRREAVVSAGAVGSPRVPELSGIGRGEVPAAAGIPVVAESRDVGENLQDHLQPRCACEVSGIRTRNERANSPFGEAMIGLEYALTRSGPMSMAPSQPGIFTRSDPSRETANLQYRVQPLSLDRFGETVHPVPAFTASVCHLRPDSRGSIHASAPDHRAEPAIRPTCLSKASDRRVAADSIRLTRRVVAEPALRRDRPEEFKPGPAYESEARPAPSAPRSPSRRHLPHGRRFRLVGGSRAAGARRRGAWGGGRLDHAAHRLGQRPLAHIMIAEGAAEMMLAAARGGRVAA